MKNTSRTGKVNLEQYVLHAVKVNSVLHTNPQVAHDANLYTDTDFISNTLAIKLQSLLYQCKDQQDVELEVEVEQRVGDMKWFLILALVSAAIIWSLALTLAIILNTLPALLLFLLIPAFGGFTIYIAEQTIKVKKKVKIEAFRVYNFPENTRVFPRDLGNPVVSYYTQSEDEIEQDN